LDSDGDVDVLSAATDSDEIAWYENDGAASPSFVAHELQPPADGARVVLAADINFDGHLDIVSGSGNDHRIAWYENDGQLPVAFLPARRISDIADTVSSLGSGDLDGDGDVDIVAAQAGSNRIVWYENSGTLFRFFIEHVVGASVDFPLSVFLEDLDADGDLDVLCAGNLDSSISWYENDGRTAPQFTQHLITQDPDGVGPLISSAQGALVVSAADLDGDGDLDVLSGSGTDNRITWYENDGLSPPTFTARTIAQLTSFPRSLFVADIDKDGDADILIADAIDDRIILFENLATIPAEASGGHEVKILHGP
jgi:FG-GAP-like repeat